MISLHSNSRTILTRGFRSSTTCLKAGNASSPHSHSHTSRRPLDPSYSSSWRTSSRCGRAFSPRPRRPNRESAWTGRNSARKKSQLTRPHLPSSSADLYHVPDDYESDVEVDWTETLETQRRQAVSSPGTPLSRASGQNGPSVLTFVPPRCPSALSAGPRRRSTS